MYFDPAQYKQHGFAPILIILLVAVLGIGGYFGYTSLRGILSGVEGDVAISPSANPTPTQDPTANWKTYTEDNYKFLVRYPENWIVSPYDYKKFPIASSDQQQLIVSFANKVSEGITLGDKERIEINIAYVKPKVSFNEFLDQRKNEAEASVPKPVGITDNETIVSELSARKIIYKYKDLINTFVYIPKGSAVYIISNSLLNEGNIVEVKKIFDQFLSTFKFTQ